MKKKKTILILLLLLTVNLFSIHAISQSNSSIESESGPGLEEKDASTKKVVEEREIPFETERRENKDLAPGIEQVVQEGVPGKAQFLNTYETTIKGDRLVSSERLNIISEPTPKIIEFGPEVAETTTEATTTTEMTTTTEATTTTEMTTTTEATTSTESTSSEQRSESQNSKSSSFADNRLDVRVKDETIKAKDNQSKKKKSNDRLPATGEYHGYRLMGIILFLFLLILV